jgi:hypothetical protein
MVLGFKLCLWEGGDISFPIPKHLSIKIQCPQSDWYCSNQKFSSQHALTYIIFFKNTHSNIFLGFRIIHALPVLVPPLLMVNGKRN